MNKILTIGIAVLVFAGIAGIARAQTATPTATPTMTITPTPTTTVPGGAPSTGFGK